MKKYRINYGIFLIVAFAASISYHSKLTSYLFLTVLVLPILSFILLILNYFCIQVKMKTDSDTITKNENFILTVDIKNNFISPLAPLCICGRFPFKQDKVIEYQQVLISVPPLKNVEIAFKSRLKYRGEHNIGVDKLKIYDVFKIFCLTKKINLNKCIIVLPRELAIGTATGNVDADNEETTANHFTLEKRAFSSIREYRQNDTIKHIHWKMSAKQDQLMVKQFECSVNNSVMIFSDFNGYSPFDEENIETTDCIIETMLAINRTLIEDKFECMNIWYDSKGSQVLNQYVSNYEDYRKLFSDMAILPVQNEIVLFEKIVELNTTAWEEPRSIFFITSQIRTEFISKLFEMSIFKMRDINILLVMTGIQDKDILETIQKQTHIKLWRLDKEHLADSINRYINSSH